MNPLVCGIFSENQYDRDWQALYLVSCPDEFQGPIVQSSAWFNTSFCLTPLNSEAWVYYLRKS